MLEFRNQHIARGRYGQARATQARMGLDESGLQREFIRFPLKRERSEFRLRRANAWIRATPASQRNRNADDGRPGAIFFETSYASTPLDVRRSCCAGKLHARLPQAGFIREPAQLRAALNEAAQGIQCGSRGDREWIARPAIEIRITAAPENRKSQGGGVRFGAQPISLHHGSRKRRFGGQMHGFGRRSCTHALRGGLNHLLTPRHFGGNQVGHCLRGHEIEITSRDLGEQINTALLFLKHERTELGVGKRDSRLALSAALECRRETQRRFGSVE